MSESLKILNNIRISAHKQEKLFRNFRRNAGETEVVVNERRKNSH